MMRFLADQDVYAATVKLLRERGHDVVTASELGRARSSDLDLLQTAIQGQRIFVTRDRDFGALVFVTGIKGGVIYLRILPSNIRIVHAELIRVLDQYDETELLSALVVVEAGRHRLRRISP
jgi:predicted nuclease of predicted toxin-antitoxin system